MINQLLCIYGLVLEENLSVWDDDFDKLIKYLKYIGADETRPSLQIGALDLEMRYFQQYGAVG